MTPPIAILGAGPSGLTLARLLELANIDYIVFERDASEVWANGRGGCLDIHAGSGQVALQEAGLLEQFKQLARTDATTKLADKTGKVVISFGEDGNDDRPEIDRQDLRSILLNSVPEERVKWDMRVEKVQREANGSMSVYFTNGRVQAGFRLVVGADGAWSKVRNLVTTATPQYSGYHYICTSISTKNPYHPTVASLAGTGNYMGLGRGTQVCAMKLGNGSYYVAVGLRLPESWAKENTALFDDTAAFRKVLLEQHLLGLPQVHTDIVKHSDGNFRDWPLFSMPVELLSWQSVPGVALVGDAAHLSTPFVGEGVNCALTDSVELAQQIIKHTLDHLDVAVEQYEKTMLPRAIDLITRSAESGELLFDENAPYGWLDSHGVDEKS